MRVKIAGSAQRSHGVTMACGRTEEIRVNSLCIKEVLVVELLHDHE